MRSLCLRRGLRFSPPKTGVPLELDWILLRAFGPANAPVPKGVRLDNEVLIGIGRGLSLLERIGSRNSKQVIESEVGVKVWREVSRAVHEAAARGMVLEESCRRFLEICSDLGTSFMLMKGMALQFGEQVSQGSRWIGDVDVLIGDQESGSLHTHLLKVGWRTRDLPAEEHHLSTLTDTFGVSFDIHSRIRGVRLCGTKSASFLECSERELLIPCEFLGSGSYLPDRDLLAAHLLVHAISQHGTRPGSYPMSKAFGDLQDLGFRGGSHGPFCKRSAPWIGKEVSAEELEGFFELLGLLEAAEPPSSIADREGNDAVLLRHMIASLQHEDYRLSLKISRSWDKSGDDGRLGFSRRGITSALFPTRGQIDIIYGPPKSSLGYLGRRLWRPFDLVARTWRSAIAWLRVRGR